MSVGELSHALDLRPLSESGEKLRATLAAHADPRRTKVADRVEASIVATQRYVDDLARLETAHGGRASSVASIVRDYRDDLVATQRSMRYAKPSEPQESAHGDSPLLKAVHEARGDAEVALDALGVAPRRFAPPAVMPTVVRVAPESLVAESAQQRREEGFQHALGLVEDALPPQKKTDANLRSGMPGCEYLGIVAKNREEGKGAYLDSYWDAKTIHTLADAREIMARRADPAGKWKGTHYTARLVDEAIGKFTIFDACALNSLKVDGERFGGRELDMISVPAHHESDEFHHATLEAVRQYFSRDVKPEDEKPLVAFLDPTEGEAKRVVRALGFTPFEIVNLHCNDREKTPEFFTLFRLTESEWRNAEAKRTANAA